MCRILPHTCRNTIRFGDLLAICCLNLAEPRWRKLACHNEAHPTYVDARITQSISQPKVAIEGEWASACVNIWVSFTRTRCPQNPVANNYGIGSVIKYPL